MAQAVSISYASPQAGYHVFISRGSNLPFLIHLLGDDFGDFVKNSRKAVSTGERNLFAKWALVLSMISLILISKGIIVSLGVIDVVFLSCIMLSGPPPLLIVASHLIFKLSTCSLVPLCNRVTDALFDIHHSVAQTAMRTFRPEKNITSPRKDEDHVTERKVCFILESLKLREPGWCWRAWVTLTWKRVLVVMQNNCFVTVATKTSDTWDNHNQSQCLPAAPSFTIPSFPTTPSFWENNLPKAPWKKIWKQPNQPNFWALPFQKTHHQKGVLSAITIQAGRSRRSSWNLEQFMGSRSHLSTTIIIIQYLSPISPKASNIYHPISPCMEQFQLLLMIIWIIWLSKHLTRIKWINNHYLEL